jgi:pimeloyl-ACP methyl ester carboxylesterase
MDYLVENGAAKADDPDVVQMRADAAAIRAIDPTRPPPPGRVMGAPAAYWLDLRGYDPALLAARNGIPILVLQGGRDYQVTEKDLEGWKRGLEGTSFATYKVFPKANHFFVDGEGKSLPVEVMKPGNVEGEVVKVIAAWVKKLPPRR